MKSHATNLNALHLKNLCHQEVLKRDKRRVNPQKREKGRGK